MKFKKEQNSIIQIKKKIDSKIYRYNKVNIYSYNIVNIVIIQYNKKQLLNDLKYNQNQT